MVKSRAELTVTAAPRVIPPVDVLPIFTPPVPFPLTCNVASVAESAIEIQVNAPAEETAQVLEVPVTSLPAPPPPLKRRRAPAPEFVISRTGFAMEPVNKIDAASTVTDSPSSYASFKLKFARAPAEPHFCYSAFAGEHRFGCSSLVSFCYSQCSDYFIGFRRPLA